MTNQSGLLAIIPARAGSSSVPSKNLAAVAGKPLLAYAIEAARRAAVVERVVVSTDSSAIAEVARQWGGEVPFLRPEELARDDIPGVLPIIHAVTWLEEHEGYRSDYVLCLQPTSPLRTAQDIEQAMALALKKQADSVISVTPVHDHPYWTKTVDAEGRMSEFMTAKKPVLRRQDLPPAYVLNGAVYLVKREVLLRRRSLYGEKTCAYVMPRERSLDIDTPWDLYLADLILRDRASSGGESSSYT